MSVLGTLVRLPEAEAERVRSAPDAYPQVSARPTQVDLERYFEVFGVLFDAANAPVNVITGGTDYPDSSTAYWGWNRPARLISASDVALAAEFTAATEWADLLAHMSAVHAVRETIYPSNHDWDGTWTPRLRPIYEDVRALVLDAARHGECLIFFAA